MKIAFRKNIFCSLLATTVLLAASTATHAQPPPPPTQTYLNTFDNDGAQPHSWIYWYGWNPGNSPITWNGSVDAATNPSSGSLEVLIPMNGNNQQVFFGTFKNQNPYDGTGGFTYDATGFYTNIEFDILVDGTMSATNPATGDFGPMFVELVGSGTPNGGGPFNDTVTIPGAASNHWVHLSVPVPNPPPAAFYTDPGVIGVVFRMDSFSSSYRVGATNHFYIDNLQVDFSGTPPPPPPPPSITSIARPLKNLNFFTTGSDYGRSSIRAQGTDNGAQYQWYNVATPANPVTYSYTLTGTPPAGHTGAGFHIYITPSPLVGLNGDLDVAPDFDANNCISITLDPNGTFTQATLTFRSKTNLPNSNGDGTTNNDLYAGPKGSVTDTNRVTGTWSCTFSNNTSVTLTSPSGFTTNFNLDPNIASIYNSPIYLYWGVSCGNTDTSKGVAYAVSHIGVTGAASTIDQTFVDGTPLDTVSTWEYKSSNGGNPQSEIFVLPVEDEQGFVLNWPQLNASGFNLQTNSVSLTASNFWSTNALAPVNIGVSKYIFLSTNDINPQSGNLFFRLAKPGF
jgi:hypothetical protein